MSLHDDNDNDKTRSKKEFFRKEVELMKTIDNLSSLSVLDVSFRLDPCNKELTIVHQSGRFLAA